MLQCSASQPLPGSLAKNFTGWVPPASPVSKSPILSDIEGKHVKITSRIEM
jgi:hypothetical protein